MTEEPVEREDLPPQIAETDGVDLEIDGMGPDGPGEGDS